MEFTIEKKTELVEKVKIQLPAYYKTTAHEFKIIDQHYCICVTHASDNVQIQKTYSELPINIEADKSTEAEFNDAFMKVISELKNLIK
jgi:hypothetical protein